MLCAKFSGEVPYRGGLDAGFPFRGRRIPFFTPYKGIYRAAAQRGPAALSVNTSFDSPYDDEATDEGFIYAYRAGAIDQPDNKALRAAYDLLQVPIIYFIGTWPGRYRPEYPYFVERDETALRRVLVSPGDRTGPLDEQEPTPFEDPLERRYAVGRARVRLHQARFRGIVLPAYRERCAICRLKEARLLDAAHIVGDAEERGDPVVSNGLSLCTIHHRAFDQHLVGISPDYQVQVARRLLEDEDGPMLEILKGSHGVAIELPSRRAARPDPERLAIRFEQFQSSTST